MHELWEMWAVQGEISSQVDVSQSLVMVVLVSAANYQ